MPKNFNTDAADFSAHARPAARTHYAKHMRFCIGNITAFDFLQHVASLSSASFVPNPASALQRCSAPKFDACRERLKNMGFETKKNLHVCVARHELLTKRNLKCHAILGMLPYRALFEIDYDLYCTGPEETYLQLAHMLMRITPKELLFRAEAQLAYYGMELCGRFFRDASNNNKIAERCAPITNSKKIAAYLACCKNRHGVAFARNALKLVEDGARSPMEIITGLLVCGPKRVGGAALPRGEMNCIVETEDGKREVDRLWKEYGIGYEYQGREYHGDETRRKEDRRRNELLRSGVTIVNIWYEDIANKAAFDALIQTLSKQMGKRLRTRSDDYAWRQDELRKLFLS